MTLRAALLIILLVAAATIAGAFVFEYAVGLQPCPLCLMQRKPYYAGMILAGGAIAFPLPSPWRRSALTGLAALFLVGAGIGTYHAGVEWAWWPGPSDCSGPSAAAPADIGGFLESLGRTRVVSCTEAAWRFLGLSLAGWNVLVSLGLAVFAGIAIRRG